MEAVPLTAGPSDAPGERLPSAGSNEPSAVRLSVMVSKAHSTQQHAEQESSSFRQHSLSAQATAAAACSSACQQARSFGQPEGRRLTGLWDCRAGGQQAGGEQSSEKAAGRCHGCRSRRAERASRRRGSCEQVQHRRRPRSVTRRAARKAGAVQNEGR